MKQFTPIEIVKALALINLSILAAAPAQAVIMDFESLQQNNFLLNIVGSSYTEDGFVLTSTTPSDLNKFVSFGLLSGSSPNSTLGSPNTALLYNTAGGGIRLAKVDGGAFTLSSIDLTGILSGVAGSVSILLG